MHAFKPHEGFVSRLAGGLFSLLVLTGCMTRSPEPRLYVFAPRDGWRAVAPRSAEDSRLWVHIAPVHVAAYLDRPQIVTRISDHEIRAHPLHRWGIPLDAAVQEMLAGSVARALPSAYVHASARMDGGREEGYGVYVEVIRLDGIPGGKVELVAQWRVAPLDALGRPLIRQLSHYESVADDDRFETYVEAVRKVVTALGEDIAGRLAEAEE